MERQAEMLRQEREEYAEERQARSHQIPATMPCPEYGESVPASSVQFVD
jgi:hypothetical protein